MATPGEQSFEEIVSAYYEALYRFGFIVKLPTRQNNAQGFPTRGIRYHGSSHHLIESVFGSAIREKLNPKIGIGSTIHVTDMADKLIVIKGHIV